MVEYNKSYIHNVRTATSYESATASTAKSASIVHISSMQKLSIGGAVAVHNLPLVIKHTPSHAPMTCTHLTAQRKSDCRSVTPNLVLHKVVQLGCLSNINSNWFGIRVRVGLWFSIYNTGGGLRGGDHSQCYRYTKPSSILTECITGKSPENK